MYIKVIGGMGSGKTSFVLDRYKNDTRTVISNIKIDCSYYKGRYKYISTSQLRDIFLNAPEDVFKDEKLLMNYFKPFNNKILIIDEVHIVIGTDRKLRERFYNFVTRMRYNSLDIVIITQVLVGIPVKLRKIGLYYYMHSQTLINFILPNAVVYTEGEGDKLSKIKKYKILSKDIYKCYNAGKKEDKRNKTLLIIILLLIASLLGYIYITVTSYTLLGETDNNVSRETSKSYNLKNKSRIDSTPQVKKKWDRRYPNQKLCIRKVKARWLEQGKHLTLLHREVIECKPIERIIYQDDPHLIDTVERRFVKYQKSIYGDDSNATTSRKKPTKLF